MWCGGRGWHRQRVPRQHGAMDPRNIGCVAEMQRVRWRRAARAALDASLSAITADRLLIRAIDLGHSQTRAFVSLACVVCSARDEELVLYCTERTEDQGQDGPLAHMPVLRTAGPSAPSAQWRCSCGVLYSKSASSPNHPARTKVEPEEPRNDTRPPAG